MNHGVLEELGRSLRAPTRRRNAITAELRAHLEETQRELILSGWPPQEAEREALSRLGNPTEIAEGFRDVYRPSRTRRVGLAFGLASLMLLGMYTASGSFASAHPAHRTVTHQTHHAPDYRGSMRATAPTART